MTLNQKFNIIHKPIFLNEIVQYLNIKKNGIYIDATLGQGNHTKKILSFLTTGILICIDQDQNQINNFKKKYQNFISGKNIIFINDKFSNIKNHLIKNKIKKIDGILYDLGPCNNQLLDQKRGFSYHLDAKIDMRFNQNQKLSAYSVLNFESQETLISIFNKFKSYQYSKILANTILKYRLEKPIISTLDFVKIIKKTIPQKKLKTLKHPARKIFLALRIYINDELNEIKISLQNILNFLNINAKILVITFHSLEDKIIKKFFLNLSKMHLYKDPHFFIYHNSKKKPIFKILTKKPLLATNIDINNNRCARSAKLRVIEKINNVLN